MITKNKKKKSQNYSWFYEEMGNIHTVISERMPNNQGHCTVRAGSGAVLSHCKLTTETPPSRNWSCSYPSVTPNDGTSYSMVEEELMSESGIGWFVTLLPGVTCDRRHTALCIFLNTCASVSVLQAFLHLLC